MNTLVSISVVSRFVLYLITFGSSVGLAVFLFPLKVRLAKCLAGVMLGIALNTAIMAFILAFIALEGRIPEYLTWREFLLFIGALVIAVSCTIALRAFRNLSLNGR